MAKIPTKPGSGKPGVARPNWVLAKIIDGDVRRCDDFEYRVWGHQPRAADADDRCTDAVYALEDAGLVTLRKEDGKPEATPEGVRHHEKVNSNPKEARRGRHVAAVTFQPAAA